MINFMKAIAICVAKEHNLDVHNVIEKYVDTKGTHHVYSDEHNVYIGFETKTTIEEIANILKRTLYRVDTKIIGGLVIVKFR